MFVRIWNLYALVYDVLRGFTPYRKLQNRVVEYLELIPHLTVLDLGCGTGNTIENIVGLPVKPYGLKIRGMERSPAMISRARKKLAGFSGVELQEGSFDALANHGERYDRIISVNGLYAAKDPLETLGLWFDLLEDGGLLVLVNPFVPRLWPIFQEHFGDLWSKKDIKGFLEFALHFPAWAILIAINLSIAKQAKHRVFHFLHPKDLQEIAQAAGFRVLKQELIYGDGSVIMSLQKETGALIRRAQRPSELEQVYKLRYAVYCGEIKSLDAFDYPDKMETDRFDPFSAHFLAKEGQELVGCIRVLSDSGRGFLLEDDEEFAIPEELSLAREKTLEISRWIVVPAKRGTGVWLSLASKVVEWSRCRGYENLIMAAQKKLWEGLCKNGLEVRLWSCFKEYHRTISAAGLVWTNAKK